MIALSGNKVGKVGPIIVSKWKSWTIADHFAGFFRSRLNPMGENHA